MSATDPLEEPELEPVVGVFDHVDQQVFTRYRVAIKFTDTVCGGIPQDPKVIENWIRKRVIDDKDEYQIMFLRTVEDLDVEIEPGDTDEMIFEKMVKAVASRNGNTFRRDRSGGLFLSDYNIKAMLKEATAIRYPWTNGKSDEGRTIYNKWGPTGKTPKDYLSEIIFVDEKRVYLGRRQPNGTKMQVGHLKGPKGPYSTLTYIDFCRQPSCTFTISSHQDRITQEQWEQVLVLGQRLGTGAVRSMSIGQFKVTAFDKVDPEALPQAAD
jgi:hypothetical protein